MSEPRRGRRRTAPNRAKPAPRLGPRPLPLHLMSAMTVWLSSRAALPALMNDWLLSKPAHASELTAAVRELAAQLAAVAPEAFAAALDRELRRRADLFLRGLDTY